MANFIIKKTIVGTIYKPGKVPVHDRLPDYEGDYSVTPKIDEQILPTKDTSMVDDMTVEAIPYHEVTNPQGGKTITIGFE